MPSKISNKYKETSEEIERIEKAIKCVLNKIGKFKVIVFNVAWVPEVYYNRANHNLQSRANGMQTPRSNQEFIELLKQKMDEAGHLVHYS